MHPELAPLKSVRETQALWSRGKLTNKRSKTNFFLSETSIERHSRNTQLFGTAIDGAAVILRRDRDFFHLYVHFCVESRLLSILDTLDPVHTYVADVVSRADSHIEVEKILEKAGFKSHRKLQRLQRSPGELPVATKTQGLEFANFDMSKNILDILELHFDRFSEQLPEIEEIRNVIRDRRILVAIRENSVAGFLYFEPNGLSSVLRYWFVDPKFRDGKIGGNLIRRYLEVECAGKTSHLWVVTDNINAKDRYNHYDYTFTDLTDHVLIRGRDF
jgi:hypothetical protein